VPWGSSGIVHRALSNLTLCSYRRRRRGVWLPHPFAPRYRRRRVATGPGREPGELLPACSASQRKRAPGLLRISVFRADVGRDVYMGIAGDAPPDAFLNDRNGGPLPGDDFRPVPCGRDCPGCASAQERESNRSASFRAFSTISRRSSGCMKQGAYETVNQLTSRE